MTTTAHLPEIFSDTEQATWAALFPGYLQRLHRHGCHQAITGLAKLGLGGEIEPMSVVNDRLRDLSGWRMTAVEGLMPIAHFYQMLRDRQFPVAPALRGQDELKFSKYPDLFHDVMGHLPFLADPAFGNLLTRLAEIELRHQDDDEAILALTRFYWFTVETGLVRQDGETKIIGAAVLTSEAEAGNALRTGTSRTPLTPEAVFGTEYGIFAVQREYFVADSYAHLLGLADELDDRISRWRASRA